MTNKLPFTAIILAGGKSSRMGQDKALLKFGEKTMLEYLTGIMSSVFSDTLIIVDKREKLDGLDLSPAKIREDFIKEKGPLMGAYTGLVLSKTQVNCIFTCDMPFVDEMTIQELANFWNEDFDVVCLEDAEERLNPFPGIYTRSSRFIMRMLIDQGEYAMKHFLELALVKRLVMKREKIRVLTNMNTIEDYYSALREKEEEIKG